MFSASKMMRSSQGSEMNMWSQVGEDIMGKYVYGNAGVSVSVSSNGNAVAIGAPGGPAAFSRVSLHNWNGSSWSLANEHVEESTSYLGTSIKISRNGASVAASEWPSKVRVYNSFSNWTRSGPDKVLINSTIGPTFGTSLDYKQDLIVGSLGGVFSDITTGREIIASQTERNSHFGREVAINQNSDIIAVTAPLETVYGVGPQNSFQSFGGSVRTYMWQWGSSPGYVQIGQAMQYCPDGFGCDVNAFTHNRFGNCVSINAVGNILATGVQVVSGGSCFVRIYEWKNGAWSARPDIPSFGYLSSVSISDDGRTVAFGLSKWTHPAGDPSQGQEVNIYSWTGSSWMRLGQKIEGHPEDDYFGTSVSLSSDGATIAFGVPESKKTIFGTNGYWSMPIEGSPGLCKVYRYKTTASIASHPSNQTAYYRGPQSKGIASFTVNANSADGQIPHCTWQYSDNFGQQWIPVLDYIPIGSLGYFTVEKEGKTLLLNDLAPEQNGRMYRALVNATGAPTLTSLPATLTVVDET